MAIVRLTMSRLFNNMWLEHALGDVGRIGGGPGRLPGEGSLTHRDALRFDLVQACRCDVAEDLHWPREGP
jgi:hypothetical protein